jgi:hypothetical protein
MTKTGARDRAQGGGAGAVVNVGVHLILRAIIVWFALRKRNKEMVNHG